MPILFTIIALSGCHSDPSEQVVARILAALAASKALLTNRQKADTEFTHFARKRIRWLVGENSSWDRPPDYQELTIRLDAEMNILDGYVQNKLGTPNAPGPLGGETESHAAPHTDLRDVAKIFVDDGASAIDDRARRFVEARRRRVRRIVWRAAAIHESLWEDSTSLTTVALKTAAMDELLDRRLRLVERMLHAGDSQADRGVVWTIASPTSWKTNLRTSVLEYPFISGIKPDRSDRFSVAVLASGRTPATLHPDWTVQPEPRTEIRYRLTGRIRPPAAPHWTLSGYKWTMKLAGKTPAQIFDLLAPATSPIAAGFEDFWNRNWLFCDHTAALLEVDALRHGLRRRTGSDTEFNEAADDGVFLHVPIPQSGKPDPSDLMDEGGDYFEGAAVDGTDLQIGDLVIIWNNFFLRVVFRTDFGLENALISDLTGEDPRTAFMVGHGAPEDSYAHFVEGLLNPLSQLTERLRALVTTKVNVGDPAHGYVNTGALFDTSGALSLQLVFWAPFEEDCPPVDANQTLGVPGPWWIRIVLATTGDSGSPPLSLEDALRLFPKSVAVELPFHSPPKFLDNHAADYRESIYIPLSVPFGVKGGWEGYFARVREDQEAGLLGPSLTKLMDLKVDKDWAPGFHHGGPGTKIPVLRPKVRP